MAQKTLTPRDAHEWVSFEDAKEDRTWVFDITFLTSAWQCIYGAGCEGVLTGPAAELVEGCCSYGAHFTDKADIKRVERAAQRLRADQWQFRAKGRRGGITAKHGHETTTRLVEDACIFLNRPGFPGGPGCALHRAALEAKVAPLTLKPDVCWQLPLRREDTVDAQGHVTSTISQWDRRHWGPAGEDFHWWCTEAPEAFTGKQPVYRELADELTELTSRAAYRSVVAYLDERVGRTAFLPHPVTRRGERASSPG